MNAIEFFNKVRPYMDAVNDNEYILKYSYASDWIVDLYKSTFGTDMKVTSNGMTFKLEKEYGRFGKYGRLYVTINN